MSVSLEEALAQLDPKLRKKLGNGVGVAYEYQPTPSFGLNKALGGGLPYGRQVLIWGSKSSAKSSMCLQMIALAQAEGKLCAWIDSELCALLHRRLLINQIPLVFLSHTR
jgi:recombination protein RecA